MTKREKATRISRGVTLDAEDRRKLRIARYGMNEVRDFLGNIGTSKSAYGYEGYEYIEDLDDDPDTMFTRRAPRDCEFLRRLARRRPKAETRLDADTRRRLREAYKTYKILDDCLKAYAAQYAYDDLRPYFDHFEFWSVERMVEEDAPATLAILREFAERK